jgi:hypothetical protein
MAFAASEVNRPWINGVYCEEGDVVDQVHKEVMFLLLFL